MSYRLDLDEMEEWKLREELDRRERLRKKGLCDYCERKQGCKPACKFPGRHRGEVTFPPLQQ